MTEAVLKRLLSKIEIDENSGCWNWIGSRYHDGYGMISINTRVTALTAFHMNCIAAQYRAGCAYFIAATILFASIPHIYRRGLKPRT